MVELEQKTIEKIKNLSAGDPSEALRKFLSVRPVGSKNKDIIRQDLQAFQNIIAKLHDKDVESLMSSLKEEEVEIWVDYLHRFMQYVGES